MIPSKGVPVPIKAVSLVREKVCNAKLVIVGSGGLAYMNGLKMQARKMNVPTVFAGRVSHRHILKIALNPTLAGKLSAEGRKSALRRFGWNHTAKKLSEIYKTAKR